ncbi:unnamed protein product [Agarophyton chilense]|eukprot:gb/GEZJ01002055.1/.p2 GENE.gb/GEZJ01002055.1/~~gb/GEZJ01002055.1/.p2  ORF type:complete len:709 (-),score=100.11 gb/GEZJ01002055.1/:3573-5699(-)
MSEKPPVSNAPSSSNTAVTASVLSPTALTPLPLTAVVCGAHTELGKLVLRELLRCDAVARVHALAEFDPRSHIRLTSAQTAKLVLHVESLEFLERTIASHIPQCQLAFCTLGAKRKPPNMDAYKFHNYNVSIPKRFVQEMFRINADRISILCTNKGSSRMSSSTLQRNSPAAADYARYLQVERRESLTQHKIPGVSVFKVSLMLTDMKDPFGVRGTAISPLEQIREKVVFKLGFGASNAVHVRDVAKAMVADALEKLDLQNEQPDLALIFKSHQTAFDELRPSDIIITANEAREAQRSRIIQIRTSRRMSSNVSGYARYQSGEQVPVEKFSPSDLSQSAVPSALPSATPSAVPSIPSAAPSAAQSPLPQNHVLRIEMEGYTAPSLQPSDHHSPVPVGHSSSNPLSQVHEKNASSPAQSITPQHRPLSERRQEPPSNQNTFQSPPIVAQGTQDPLTSPIHYIPNRSSARNVNTASSPEQPGPSLPVTSSVDALGHQLSRRLTVVHSNEQLPGASVSPRRLSRRKSAKEIRSQNTQTTELLRRKSTSGLSRNEKALRTSKSPNSKSRSSRSPPQHPFESDGAKSPTAKYSDAQSSRGRPSRSSQRRNTSGRSVPTASFHSGHDSGEGGRRRSEVDSLRYTKATHGRRRSSLPTASAILSQISLLASRILEATDRPSVKRYRQAYDPNYLPRGDPRRNHGKDRRAVNATMI